MKDGATLTIRKASNGWIVEPEAPLHSLIALEEILVFNAMGYASSPGDNGSEPCLLKFIEKHFALPTEPKLP